MGGTHTDAVLVSEKNDLLSAVKTSTTRDVTIGIVKSMDLLLKESGANASEIGYAMIGTTHCINAIVQRKGLDRVAVVRIGLPAGAAVGPMMDWPPDLRAAVGDFVYNVHGGYEYDGREISPLSEEELTEAAIDAKKKELKSVAISGIFSPVKAENELRAATIFSEILGEDTAISLSHKIGSLGLIERENATILNAAVVSVARAAAEAFERACSDRGIAATIYFSQNDGTLMSVDYAKSYPILTVSSGPTNSIRGAAFLTGLSDCLVVDIGGTTTLVGVMVKGFPRQSAAAIELDGVRTNFRMPDLVSIGCGGGSVVRKSGSTVTIGPDSVGYDIRKESVAWGGEVVTNTDISLAAGYATIQDEAINIGRVKDLETGLVRGAVAEILRNVEISIDRAKTSAEAITMVLVGGGGIIIPPDHYGKIRGVSKVIRPSNFQYANALGAAISQVSGEIDMVFPLEHESREDVLKKAKELAVEESVKAGAERDSVEVVDIDEIYLSYLPSNAVRIKVKAAGQLSKLMV